MRAILCEAFGGPEVLALRQVPSPGPDKPASRKCGQYQTGGDIAHSVGYRYAELPSTCLLLCDVEIRSQPHRIPPLPS
jgi:hypothetical protein